MFKTTIYYDSSESPAGVGEHTLEVWNEGINAAIGNILDALDRKNAADKIVKFEIDPNAEYPA
jgi:hypothetical protein